MGMFDSFYFDRKTPDGFQKKIPDGESVPPLRLLPDAALFQTKCLDCDLDIYTVDERDRLMRYKSGSYTGSDPCPLTFVEYTGTVEIYTGIPQAGEYGYPNKYIQSTPEPIKEVPVWRCVEYVLTFENGILKNVSNAFDQ